MTSQRPGWLRWPLRRRPFTHLDDYSANNSPEGLADAAAHSLRIDLDLQVARGGEGICTHWPHPRIERFGLGGRIPRRPFRRLRWRRIAKLRTPAGRQIHTMTTMLRLAAEAGVREVEIDAKDDRRLERASWWRPLAAYAADLRAAYGMTVVVKTSSALGGARRAGRRMRAAHRAGLPTLLLTRGDRRMPRRFERYIDDVRGLPVAWIGRKR